MNTGPLEVLDKGKKHVHLPSVVKIIAFTVFKTGTMFQCNEFKSVEVNNASVTKQTQFIEQS